MIKVSDYIVSYIANLGVKHIFILAGGQAMHIIDSIGRSERVQHISALHEQAAAMMAEAYSRVTENMGVAVVTTGPGGTNTMTGLAGAWLDSTPCMYFSGQFRVENTNGDQNIRQTILQGFDIVSLVKPITKYAVMIDDPQMVKYHLDKAVYMAREGRPGPVWLDVPLDIQSALVDETTLIPFVPGTQENITDVSLIRQQVREYITSLKTAERPVLFAGNGIRLAHAVDIFRELADKLSIPVLTSINGMDLIHEEHPCFLGRPNYWGQRYSNFTVQNSDLLLSIGSGLDLSITGFNYCSFAREAKKFVVDIDKNELYKKSLTPDVRINCDAKLFIEILADEIKNTPIPEFSQWLTTCHNWKKEYPIILDEFIKQEEKVHPFVFVDILSSELAENEIVIPGNAGTHFTTSAQAFKVKKGQRIFSEVGVGAMGYSIPASIAACIASGKKRTICVTGDGGIQLNIQELQTILTYNLPIKIFVMNNGGYLSIKNTQKNYFAGNYVGCNQESGLKLPDMVKIAEAYGYKTERIFNHQDLRGKIRKVLDYDGPILCDVVMAHDQILQPRLASKMLPDGRMISSPLEELSPLLDEQELSEHLFIKAWTE